MTPLSLRLENHWLACMASLAGGARVTRLGGALIVTNPSILGSLGNFLTLRNCDPARLGQVLELGEAMLAESGRTLAVYLSPASGEMERLGEHLHALGLRCTLHQTVLMADVTESLPPAPAEVDVEVIGQEHLSLWEETLVAAYEAEPYTGQAIAHAWGSLLTAPGEGASASLYLARIGGEAVGTGLSWTQGDMTGLYCGAVLPAYRRCGVERATVVRRLADAYRSGSRIVHLQTESGSPVEHLCRDRLNFRVAYYRELWIS